MAEKFAALKTDFLFPLLSLPNELIALIIEQIESPKALGRLSRTCRRLQHLTEPVLYRNLLIRSVTDASAVRRALTGRSERGAGIHSLDIPCDFYRVHNFGTISTILHLARNLKNLMFESPECNNGDFEDQAEWTAMTNQLFTPFQAAIADIPRCPLHKLRKLTLHINGCSSPYWTLDARSFPILLHPTLQYLKISCVNIMDDILDHGHQFSPSPLKHLELEECNITHKGLAGLLSLQKGLQTLYLGENCHNIRNFPEIDVDASCNHLFRTDAQATLAALRQQKESLQSLTYVTTETIYQHRHLARFMKTSKSHAYAGFADFHALEVVQLIGSCPDFEQALMTSRSPPNLQKIKCEDTLPINQDFGASEQAHPLEVIPFFRVPSCSVPPSLRTFDITFDLISQHHEVDISEIMRDSISETSKAIEKIGIELQVTYRAIGTFYPPFLWGEPLPQEELVFAGHNTGFVGRFAAPSKNATSMVEVDASSEEEDSSSEEDEDE